MVKLLINDEVEGVLKEMDHGPFKVLSQNFNRMTEENKEKPQSRLPASRPEFEGYMLNASPQRYRS
jgi:small nuclear ribonucleoprotein (snRNP)-like protein